MRRVWIFTLFPAMLLMAGCVTPASVGDLHRMGKYRPVPEPIVIPQPAVLPVAAQPPAAGTVNPAATQVTAPTEAAVTTDETAATEASVKTDGATVKEVTATAQETEPALEVALPAAGTADAPVEGLPAQPETAEAASVGDGTGKAQGQRNLSRGDRIMISLRGIPRGEEIKNIIDGLGEVTLPYIGQVRVAGLTPSDAERLIETTYVNRGIYRLGNINVIVVAEDKVYFVQGEVARQGKFSMSGDVTLLQAITEAGGYTPFANRRSVKIIRGDQVLFYNARDIANGRTPDPVIASDDIIVVLRSVF